MAYSLFRRSFFVSSPHFCAIPALFLLLAVALSGCHSSSPSAPAVTDPKDPNFIVAEKGDLKITNADLDKEVENLLKQHQATPDQVGQEKMLLVKTSVLKNMILKDLLLAKGATLNQADVDKECDTELDAIKSRIPPGTDLDAQLKTVGMTLDDVKKQIHDKVVIEQVLKAEAFKNDDPTDQEINDFYLKNKAQITEPPQVRASRILVHVDDKMSPADKAAKKKIIDKAHDRVAHGEDFSKVALQVSEDQSSKTKGGDLDYFRPGQNEAGFDNVAFRTKLGAVSPVFETPLGYQFIKVTDVKPGGEVPLAEVRPKIQAYLREGKMQKQGEEYVKNLLANSGVVYHMTLVDPPAQMPGAGPGAAGPDSAPPSSSAPATVTTPPVEAPAASTNSAPAK
jgi:parvulin-like peptidyl-prolyl isomerase